MQRLPLLLLLTFFSLWSPSPARMDNTPTGGQGGSRSSLPAPPSSVTPIPDSIWNRMQGRSYVANPYIGRDDLRYLRLPFVNKEGETKVGEMICNKLIADEIVEIFTELYKKRYPIERMQLIDDYDGDDERSMRANNTSCFCLRLVNGSSRLSKHAQGLAIDINPLYNPYIKVMKNGRRVVQPSTAARYCNRAGSYPYKITVGDACHRLFMQHGYRWGGSWRTLKDYQHFEK